MHDLASVIDWKRLSVLSTVARDLWNDWPIDDARRGISLFE